MAALRKRMFTFEKLSQPAADLPPARPPRIAPANCICRPRSIRFLDSQARPETIESLQRTTGEFHEATYSRDRRPVMCGGTGAGANTRGANSARANRKNRSRKRRCYPAFDGHYRKLENG